VQNYNCFALLNGRRLIVESHCVSLSRTTSVWENAILTPYQLKYFRDVHPSDIASGYFNLAKSFDTFLAATRGLVGPQTAPGGQATMSTAAAAAAAFAAVSGHSLLYPPFYHPHNQLLHPFLPPPPQTQGFGLFPVLPPTTGLPQTTTMMVMRKVEEKQRDKFNQLTQ
jgi:hypothetical protein